MKNEHKEIIVKMDDFIEGCDTKYAPYAFYKVAVWMSGIIVSCLILSVMALVGRVYLHLY